MILEENIKQQLKTYLELLENDILIKKHLGTDKNSLEAAELLEELVSMSSKIHVEETILDRTPSFSINQMNEDTGIVFSGVPLGHEFSSLVLALLQVSGRPTKVEESIISRIKAIDRDLAFETYVSLECHNCPDVVQALNLMALLNPRITHTMIEGGAFREEVENRDIMAVPTIYLNGQFFNSGRLMVEDILSQLGSKQDYSKFDNAEIFDVLVIGGGPAGSSAAIYSARKGLRTGIIAERFGGQTMETTSIENLISVPHTEGTKFSRDLEAHVREYDVEIITGIKAKSITKKDNIIEVELEDHIILKTKSLIIATGAKWRDLGVPGEKEFRNKGIAYCAHCDGPLYKSKNVAVVGGGNSGVEAAIDLANIVEHVTVLESSSKLKADLTLQEKLASLSNVTVLTNVQIKEISGESKVEKLIYMDKLTNEKKILNVEGIFVQIGLYPHTAWLGNAIEMNQKGEIITDKAGATSLEGVFAAGDCTDSLYKQIIIAMGSGATASLSAFDYLIRNHNQK